jgi:DNA-binding NarL/FixJ family response regulator
MLPCLQNGAGPRGVFRSTTPHAIPQLRADVLTRVLIVDDQPAFRRHLRRLLTRAGLTVVGEAGGISQAEALVQALEPDLAVVDVTLPGVNGLEDTPRLKALAPRLRVILVSAHRDQAQVWQAAADGAGAEAFISKADLDVNVGRAGDRLDMHHRRLDLAIWPEPQCRAAIRRLICVNNQHPKPEKEATDVKEA